MLRRTIIFYLSYLNMLSGATQLKTTRQFSKSLYGFEKLTAFVGVSITQCEERCFDRARCKGALYNRRTTVCTLTGVQRRGQYRRRNNGTVFAVGFYRLQLTLNTPICASCAREQTCETTADVDRCTYTECGAPPSIYNKKYLGNMFSVNNTLVVQWDAATSAPIKCGEGGRWEPVNTPCLPGWTNFDTSCYFLDETKRQQHEAKSFCKEMRPGTHLADLNTPTESTTVIAWLTRMARQNIAPVRELETAKPSSGAWLGGQRNATTHEFEWSDGTSLTRPTFWDIEQPESESARCLAAVSPSFLWHDCYCTDTYQSLCEYTFV